MLMLEKWLLRCPLRSVPTVPLRALSTRSPGHPRQVTLETHPYKLHKLEQGPPAEALLTHDEAMDYYRKMEVIRVLDMAAGSLYMEHKVRGFCHLYSGQEACAVGIVAAMDKEDALITSYRCHGWTYLMGSTATEVLSELTGGMSGNVFGKGGSMHMYDRHYFGGNGIVGAQQSLGTGVAFAMKYLKLKGVSYTLYGDGAANQGQLYESMNMAKLWNLPVVYICENNGYGWGTPAERSSASTDYYTRGDYVPGVCADGMDVVSVREAMRFAREHCVNGKGPMVVEMRTYRYVGHTMSDPGTGYRTREEVREVRRTRDPIHGLKEKILASGLVTQEELNAADSRILDEIQKAKAVAEADDPLPRDGLYTDIYANSPPLTIRGTTPDSQTKQHYTTSEQLLRAMGRQPKAHC